MKEFVTMLRFAMVFMILALLAAFFGFAGVQNYSFDGAKSIFVVFLVLAVGSFLGGMLSRRSAWRTSREEAK
jgi:uncharacterized membrane protein YtjA (UPF0391 family)